MYFNVNDENAITMEYFNLRTKVWCVHLIVVVGSECSQDPQSYAGGSVATGTATHAGQVKG
jgi:hypothetical protein